MTRKPEPPDYQRLLVSQDNHEIWLTLATYNPPYVQYERRTSSHVRLYTTHWFSKTPVSRTLALHEDARILFAEH
ncbi:hypothetical protein N7519_004946 [Penicillium mononematosum]|uniref:uncharacterized protein n=1 Tax=Penicillium mononematosum TaxID=268346 RepID=UPI002547E137|nr:uncharacterized protein N7519_004946 [Penicillium mononematosum]KAJ6183645.1 hypothetical protein N7519_004946 [Penicillium mononematosum]